MAKVVFLGPGEGRLLVVGPNTTTLKAVTDDTEGRFSVIEGQLDAHFPGPPVHVHDQLDHAIYVLEGRVVLTVEQRQLTAPAGSFALIPHGIAHTFANPATPWRGLWRWTPPPASNGTLSAWLRPLLPAASSTRPPWRPSRPSTTPTRRPPDPLSPRAGQVRQAIAGNEHHHPLVA
jgi:mannose-6-phosphate isomerase-like protein (cupin superfamily)